MWQPALREEMVDTKQLDPGGIITGPSEWRRKRFFSRALHRAVVDGSEKGVSDVLEQGGTSVIDHRDEIGLSPLHRASIKGPPNVVRILCNAGADREATFEGLTSLHMACGRGHENIVSVLLEEGADRVARTLQGFTPLHCASGRGGLGCVKVLLKAGVDANVQSEGRQRRTPLHAAAVLGNNAVTVELLRWGAAVDIPDMEGITSLHIAAAMENLEVTLTLLRAGASTGVVQAGTLNTPLHLAAFQGARSIGSALVQAGADVSARNASRESPLHLACMMLHLAFVEMLLRQGANEAVCNNDGHTPFDDLGRGIDEDGGSTGRSESGSDPETRDRIAAVLARAPVERKWRRRSWLVMMRARAVSTAAAAATGSDSRAQESGDEEGYRTRACFGTTSAVVIHGNMRKGEAGVLCREDGGSASSADKAVASCVFWVVGMHEEGIFRHVVSFV